jgi:hypothetical protein
VVVVETGAEEVVVVVVIQVLPPSGTPKASSKIALRVALAATGTAIITVASSVM